MNKVQILAIPLEHFETGVAISGHFPLKNQIKCLFRRQLPFPVRTAI